MKSWSPVRHRKWLTLGTESYVRRSDGVSPGCQRIDQIPSPPGVLRCRLAKPSPRPQVAADAHDRHGCNAEQTHPGRHHGQSGSTEPPAHTDQCALQHEMPKCNFVQLDPHAERRPSIFGGDTHFGFRTIESPLPPELPPGRAGWPCGEYTPRPYPPPLDPPL